MGSKSASPKPTRNAPLWIKAFVAMHVVTITMWTLPLPKKPYREGTIGFGVKTSSPGEFVHSFSNTVTEGILYFNWKYIKSSPLMYYAGTVGFWQYWDMFAPNPASTDLYLTAEVTFKNGQVKPFKFPRVYDFSIPEKYAKERYRKFFENANGADERFASPYVAQRIALESFTDPANPPVTVTLTRNFYQIQPPGQPQPTEYSHFTYYTYQVDEQKLRRDAGIEQ
ncbi:MAG: hypothetical protein BGO01_06285 [Armatimonadetes bacterium 55-13]|nr:hypothetical protein [Armatimonadota bacterium]OJU65090.1 MAG: hypothetical protein BGO01_06285 [Armatimonadetes bacterium 55-13]